MKELFQIWQKPIAFCSILAAVLMLLALHPTLAGAQATVATGSIQGTILDPQGGAVAGAKVTFTNKSTGQVLPTTTNSTGAFNVAALIPGDYTVRVEAKGFKTAETTVRVELSIISTTNLTLEVGSESTVVNVEASAIAVNTQQATVQDVITATQIEELPVNGRNFLDLASLEPGVQVQDGANFDPTKNGFSSISFGGRSATNPTPFAGLEEVPYITTNWKDGVIAILMSSNVYHRRG